MSLIDSIPRTLRVNRPMLVAGAAIAVSAVVVAVHTGSLFGSLFASSIDEGEADPLAMLSEDSEDLIAQSRKRFEGRSMFTLPTPPRPPAPPPPPPREPETPRDPPPPPIPATYTGPAVTHVIGEYVLFGELRIKRGDTEAGITVISIDAPYSVKLGHRGGEYTVPLWPRIDERFLRGGGPPSGAGVIAGAGEAKSGDATLRSGGTPGGSSSGFTTRPGEAAGAAVAGAPSSGAGRGSSGTRGGSRDGANPSANPVTETPRPGSPAGPGQVPPSDGGAGGDPVPSDPNLPSRAMEPQRLPPPPSDQAPVEYVDRSLLPAPLSEAQIDGMSLAQAREAAASIDATATWTVDDHSRARLDWERKLLQNRINRGS